MIDYEDPNFQRIAFFASRNIEKGIFQFQILKMQKLGEELTINYFNDRTNVESDKAARNSARCL